MNLFIVSFVLFAVLPLTYGRICWNNVSVPYVKWGRRYVSRTTTCDYQCWGKWRESQIDSSYYLNTCELTFRTESQPECCPGYVKDVRGECVPICRGGCVGGQCIGPYQCACEEGFRLVGNRCIPQCESRCIYGVCTGPERCSCLAGYTNKTNTECEPVCDPPCVNGKCIASDSCECNHGFEKSPNSNHQCKPRCDPEIADCGNGSCIQPNRCSCSKGYVFRGNRCIPQCDPSCINAECSKPNTCTCFDGFSKGAAPNICSPHCNEGCQNGTCVAPNTCHCLQGYQLSPNNPNSCNPTCDPEFFNISNGQCIAPNILRCNEGFLLKSSKESNMIHCKSRCDPECINARCLPDGSCQCRHGFSPFEESPNICQPLCDPPCENSTCISTNICKCWDGYRSALEDLTETSCSPSCDPAVVDCSNGSCIGANICICNEDYELISNEDDIATCYPTCLNPCINGFCPLSPDTCECLPGHNRTSLEQDCTPVCDDSCRNGTCTAPGVCSCDPGFRFFNETCEQILEHSRSGLIQYGSTVAWVAVVVITFCIIYFVRLLCLFKKKLSFEVEANYAKGIVNLKYYTEGISDSAVKEEHL